MKNNDYIDIENSKKEKIFVERLIEIAQTCNEHRTYSCIYEVGTRIGKMEVKMEFSYEINEEVAE